MVKRSRIAWDVMCVVAAGGAIGAWARMAIANLMADTAGLWPVHTLLANLTGSFALALVAALIPEVWPLRRYLSPFIGTGILGGYTTFSAVMLEGLDLTKGGNAEVAIAYVAITLVGGIVATMLGILIGQALQPPHEKPAQ